jgi:uroporphyrinogen-III synthase
MKLIITRPRQDSESLLKKLEGLGHDVLASPLLEIVQNPRIMIPARPWAALLVTSANGVRCLPQGLVSPDVRVIAVGAQSAEAARAFGFHNVEARGGDVEQLGNWIVKHFAPAAGPLLYVTGKEISGDLAGTLAESGFEVCRVETYQARPKPLELSLEDIEHRDGVLLYSPRSAKFWLAEITVRGLTDAAARLRHYCLSPAVAHILPQDWRITVASAPTESALLQLLEPAGKGE